MTTLNLEVDVNVKIEIICYPDITKIRTCIHVLKVDMQMKEIEFVETILFTPIKEISV